MKSAYSNRNASMEREIQRRVDDEVQRLMIVCETACLFAMHQEFHWKKKGLTRLFVAMVRYAAQMKVGARWDDYTPQKLGENIEDKYCKQMLKENAGFDFDEATAILKGFGVDVAAMEDNVVDYDRKTGMIIFKEDPYGL